MYYLWMRRLAKRHDNLLYAVKGNYVYISCSKKKPASQLVLDLHVCDELNLHVVLHW